MPNHMLLMSYDASLNLLNTLERFFEYTLALLPKKKNINFCYIGTAANDRYLQELFLSGFMYLKFGRYINTSKLLLTTELTPSQIEAHIRKQDIIFVDGGNTHHMLNVWQQKGFSAILTKLKNEDALPILTGVSAGGMYPFHSGLSDYIPKKYTPLKCLGWFEKSFCAHADSTILAECDFDNQTMLARLPAYQAAIKSGQLPPGYAVPNDCMLHMLYGECVRVLSTRPDVTCSFVTPESIQPLRAVYLTKENSITAAKATLSRTNPTATVIVADEPDTRLVASSCSIA